MALQEVCKLQLALAKRGRELVKVNMHTVVAVYCSVAASLLWQVSTTTTDAWIEINEATAVPVGHTANFTCETSKEPWWRVQNHRELDFLTSTDRDIINEKYGINVSVAHRIGRFSYSSLVIEGGSITNGSVIHCGTQESSGAVWGEENVTFSVFDAPSGLVSRPVDENHVLLLWSPSLIHPTISYIVEVTSDGHNVSSFITNSTSFLLRPSMLSKLPRLPYHTKVKAANELGQETDFGDGVDACTRIDVSSSIDCEVEITPSSILITVSFTSPSCSFYEDSSLIWREAQRNTAGSGAIGVEYGTASLASFTAIDTRVSLLFNSTHIRENAVITYVIQVFENISISRERTFYTTDVQEATILLDLDAGFFEVTCRFATGSRAKGCVLVLGGLEYNISRSNNSASYSQYFTQPSEELTYSVYDWEEDGSTGIVAVTVQNITRTSTIPSPAPPHTSQLPPHQPSKVLPPYAILLVVVVLALLFLVLCVIVLCCACKCPYCRGNFKTYTISKSSRKGSNCYTTTEVKRDGELWHGGEDTYSTVYDNLQHHSSKHGASSLPGPPPVPSSPFPSSHPSSPSSPLGPQLPGQDTEDYATLEETNYSTIAKIPLYHVLEKPPSQESIQNGKAPQDSSFALYSEVNDGPPPFSSPMYTEGHDVGTSMEESRPPFVPVSSHLYSDDVPKDKGKQTEPSSSLQMYSEVYKGRSRDVPSSASMSPSQIYSEVYNGRSRDILPSNSVSPSQMYSEVRKSKSREKSLPPIIPMVVLEESDEQQASSQKDPALHVETSSEVCKEEGVPLTPPPVYTEVQEGQVPPKTPPPMYSE